MDSSQKPLHPSFIFFLELGEEGGSRRARGGGRWRGWPAGVVGGGAAIGEVVSGLGSGGQRRTL